MTLINFLFDEPAFDEVYAKSDIEIVLFEKWIGVSLTVTPFKADVYCGLVTGDGETEAERCAIVADFVVLNDEVIVVEECTEAILDAFAVSAADVGLVLNTE
jgi:hypothetical protein